MGSASSISMKLWMCALLNCSPHAVKRERIYDHSPTGWIRCICYDLHLAWWHFLRYCLLWVESTDCAHYDVIVMETVQNGAEWALTSFSLSVCPPILGTDLQPLFDAVVWRMPLFFKLVTHVIHGVKAHSDFYFPWYFLFFNLIYNWKFSK